VKYLAVIDVADGVTIERIQANIRDELLGSWRLFESGVLREAYATPSPTRVVFVLEADELLRADEYLRKLPLVAAGLLRVDLMELRPFVNWARLFESPKGPQSLAPEVQ
jgi:hypothetical protein